MMWSMRLLVTVLLLSAVALAQSPSSGRVEGRVIDRNGEPVAAHVQLVRVYDSDRLQFSTEATSSADETGQFRIENVRAGHYLLFAYPIPPAQLRREVDASAYEQNLPSYYPGVSDPFQATTIRVDAPVQNVELRVTRGRMFTIQGQLTVPYVESSGVLLAVRPVGNHTVSYPRVRLGSFQTESLVPGTYSLSASYTAPGDRYPSLHGRVDVTITDANVGGVTIPLTGRRSDATLTGRVRIEGVTDYADYIRRSNALFRDPVRPVTTVLRGGQDYALARRLVLEASDVDGSFRVEDFSPARYQYEETASSYPLNSYLRTILLNGTELEEGVIDLTSGQSATLELVFAIDGGTLAFIRPPGWPAVSPALTPPNARRIYVWPVRSETPIPRPWASYPIGAGFATIDNLPPGEYFLALFEEDPPPGLTGLNFLSLFNDAATRVVVSAGSKTTIQPGVIRGEDVQRMLAGFPRNRFQ